MKIEQKDISKDIRQIKIWNDPTTAGFYAKHVLWNKPTMKESIADLNKKFSKLKVSVKSD